MGGRTAKRRESSVTAFMVALLDEAFERRAWHGTTLRGSLRGMTETQASWRPEPERHNVWEIVLHCAYWKYVVRRRLSDQPRGTFSLPGSDWFPTPIEATEAAWRKAIELLRDEHRRLLRTVQALSPEVLT